MYAYLPRRPGERASKVSLGGLIPRGNELAGRDKFCHVVFKREQIASAVSRAHRGKLIGTELHHVSRKVPAYFARKQWDANFF
jgi:hypothetical protein